MIHRPPPLSRCQSTRDRLRGRRGPLSLLPTVSGQVAALETRTLLSNVPLLVGSPMLAPSSNLAATISGPIWLSPPGPMLTPPPADAHPFVPESVGVAPGLMSVHPIPVDPAITGPGSLSQLSLTPTGSENTAPSDQTNSSPSGPSATSSPATTQRPGPPRSLVAEAALVEGNSVIPEVAVANEQAGTVTVYAGSRTVFTATGLDDPEAVKLADLNHTGTPDLIIADSGANKILVYPGLASGGFGPEITHGVGIAVGTDPVNINVADLNHNGQLDILVANRGSNTVSILTERGLGSMVFRLDQTIPAGIAPVRVMTAPSSQDPDLTNLLICNSGSNNVYWYKLKANGTVATSTPHVIPVGDTPVDMTVGQYSHQAGDDALVTTNPGSDNITIINSVFGDHPDRQDIGIPGFHPMMAIPVALDRSGASDLIVASSNGQFTLFQAGETTLQPTGLVATTGLSELTSLTTGEWTTSGLAIYEASSGSSAVGLFHFNLEDAVSTIAPMPAVEGITTSTLVTAEPNSSLNVEIVPVDAGASDLVGVLWTRSNRTQANDSADAGTTGSGRPVTQAAGTASTDLDHEPVIASNRTTEADELDNDAPSTRWTRFVVGLDAALDAFGGEVAAVAAAEPFEADEWPLEREESTRLADRPPGVEPRFNVLRSEPHWLDSPEYRPLPTPPERGRAGSSALRLIPGSATDAATDATPEFTTAAVGSAVAISLIIKALPPRPSRFRPEPRQNPVFGPEPVAPWPEVEPPPAHGG